MGHAKRLRTVVRWGVEAARWGVIVLFWFLGAGLFGGLPYGMMAPSAGTDSPRDEGGERMGTRISTPIMAPHRAWAGPSSAPEKVLIVLEDALPATLNPLRITTLTERRTLELVHDAPYLIGNDIEPVPSLIATVDGQGVFSQRFDDPLVLEGRLKSATFQDGRPITVKDLKRTLLAYQAAADTPDGNPFYKDLYASIEADPADKHHGFRIRLTHPIAFSKDALTPKILPSHAFRRPTHPETFRRDATYEKHPLGAGPFQFVKNPPGSHARTMVFKAYPDYHQGKPLLDRIEIREIGDPNLQVEQLRNGLAHVVPSVSKAEETRFRDLAHARIVPYYVRNWWYLGFDCADPILKNKKIRQGISKIINRKKLAGQLADNIGVASRAVDEELPRGPDDDFDEVGHETVLLLSGPFVPESPFYNFDVPQPTLSPADATALFLQSGVVTWDKKEKLWRSKKTGEIIDFNFAYRRDMPGAEDVANLVRQQLLDFGIQTTLFGYSAADWREKVRKQRSSSHRVRNPPQILLSRFYFDTDADDITQIFITNGKLNYFHYSDKELDKVLKAANAPDVTFDQRVLRMREAHRMVAESVPALVLWEAYQVAAFSRKVKAFMIHSFSFYVNPDRWDVRESR